MSAHRISRIAWRFVVLGLLLVGPVEAQPPSSDFILQSGRGLDNGAVGVALAFTPDGRRLAVAGYDGVQLIDVATQRETGFIPGVKGVSAGLAFTPDGRWLASERGQYIQIWDAERGREAQRLELHSAGVLGLVFSADGQTLFSAGGDASVIEWDWRNGRALRVASHPTDDLVYGVQLSPDARRVVEVSGRPYRDSLQTAEIKVYEATTERVVSSLAHPFNPVTTLSFSLDAGWVAMNGEVWNLESAVGPDAPPTVSLRDADVLAIDSSAQAVIVLRRSEGDEFQLWDLRSGRVRGVLGEASGRPISAALTPDGRSLAVALVRNACVSVRLWDLATMRGIGEVLGPSVVGLGDEWPREPAAFSPDGRLLAVGSGTGVVRIWSVHDWIEAKRLDTNCVSIREVRFSPRGDTLAISCDGRYVEVWDLARQVVTRHVDGATHSFEYTPDGTSIASVQGYRPKAALNFTEIATGRLVRSQNAPNGPFRFTSDGRRIIGVLESTVGPRVWDTIRLASWDAHTGERTGRVYEDGNVFAVSADGSLLATRANLFDLVRGLHIRQYTPPPVCVSYLAFSPSGRWLATGWADSLEGAGSVKIWDTRSWRQVATLTGHTEPVTQILFSPDGHTLVTASPDRTLRVWSLDRLEH